MRYTTRTEAIEREILDPISNSAQYTDTVITMTGYEIDTAQDPQALYDLIYDEYDVERIAQAVLVAEVERIKSGAGCGFYRTYYRRRRSLDTNGLWALISEHAA